MILRRKEVLLAAVFAFTFVSTAQAKSALIKIIFPLKTIQRESTPIPFSWVPLPMGASVEKYDLTLYLFDRAGTNPRILNRATVSESASPLVELGGILPVGNYAWKIEAKDKRGAVVGAGQARFTVSNEAFRRPGIISVGAGFSITNYSYSSQTSSLSGDVPESLIGFTGSLEYYLPSDWVSFVSYSHSSLIFAGTPLPFSELAIGGSHRSKLDKRENWHLNLGLKLSKISVPQLTPQDDQSFKISSVSRTMVTPMFGFDYRMADNAIAFFQVGAGMALSTANSGEGTLTQVKRNLSYSVTGGMRGILVSPWGYNLQTTYLIDGFGYSTQSQQTILTSYRGYNVQIAATRSF